MAETNPHDSLVRRALALTENAAGELKTVLPQDVAARIEWGTLTLEPGSFVDEKFRNLHTDLLYSVEIRDSDERVLIYVLLEHQSSNDSWMPLRLLRYVACVWESHVAKNPSAGKLPIVIPVVLAHGESPWSAPTEMRALLAGSPALQSVVGPFVPNFRYLLDDLRRTTPDELRRRAMPEYGRIALLFLRNGRSGEDLPLLILDWSDVFQGLVSQPSGLVALSSLVGYLSLVAEQPDPDEFRRVLEEAAGPKAKETIVTWAEKWKAEGEARGEAKGRTEGRAEALRLVADNLRKAGMSEEQICRIIEKQAVEDKSS